MKFNVNHYIEYITYLLDFDGPLGHGNTMGNASLSGLYSLCYEPLTEKVEVELISNLEFEKEDLEYFNPDREIVSVHDFVSSFTREQKLSNLLDD